MNESKISWYSWLFENLIYCESSHSFCHLLYDTYFQRGGRLHNYKDFQFDGLDVKNMMYNEYLKRDKSKDKERIIEFLENEKE